MMLQLAETVLTQHQRHIMQGMLSSTLALSIDYVSMQQSASAPR